MSVPAKSPVTRWLKKGDEERRRPVVAGQCFAGDLPAQEGRGDGGPEHLGRCPPPLVDRLFPVPHEEEGPLPLGIFTHGAEDVLHQRLEQGELDLRRVLEFVEEQMGRPVESQLVEAGQEEGPIGAVGSVEGDEGPGGYRRNRAGRVFPSLRQPPRCAGRGSA